MLFFAIFLLLIFSPLVLAAFVALYVFTSTTSLLPLVVLALFFMLCIILI